MPLPDTDSLRPFRYSVAIATAAFLLCFAGSSIYLIQPLRPFHWGLGLVVVLFTINREWRHALLRTRSRSVIAVATGLILASSLWTINSSRYAIYAMFFAIGALHMVLGETMVQRGVSFEHWFFPLAIYWFVTAYFPAFDTWTNAALFRDSLPITSGVWYNINDMATALVFACLIWLLGRRRISLVLFAAAWIYGIGLNRRADVLALGILGLAHLIGGLGAAAPRLRFAATWTIATAVGMAMHGGTFFIGAMSSLVQERPFSQCPPVSQDAIPLDMIAAQCVPPPPSATSHPPSAAAPMAVPPTIAMPSAAGESRDPPITPTAPPSPEPPAVSVDVVAHDGDVSSAIRSKLLIEMYDKAREMSWRQWLTGLGIGQLDVKWPLNHLRWASPHFFWLEMLFFFGLPWIAFIGWLFWRADRYGRLALIVASIAGIGPSSLVYFQPFWFLLGVVLATLPRRSDGLNS